MELINTHCYIYLQKTNRCYDDQSQFYFDNGAVVHYYFADPDKNKNIKDALKFHGNAPLDYYDVVFANNGNRPRMAAYSMLGVADELNAAGVSEMFAKLFINISRKMADYCCNYQVVSPYLLYVLCVEMHAVVVVPAGSLH